MLFIEGNEALEKDEKLSTFVKKSSIRDMEREKDEKKGQEGENIDFLETVLLYE